MRFIISPSRRSSLIRIACASFCDSICSARTLPTSLRLVISSSSRRSSSASIRRMASCCFWYHRSSASTSRSRCRCFTSICRSRSSITSASISFECSDLTRSVESYSILFARSIASRRFSACSASSSRSISTRSFSSASSFSDRMRSLRSRRASIVLGHWPLRVFESSCSRLRSSCLAEGAGAPSRVRFRMPFSSAPEMSTASLTDAGIERAICTAFSCGLPKSDSST